MFAALCACAFVYMNVQHKTDLSRFVRWPRYIRIQRQRKVRAFMLVRPAFASLLFNDYNSSLVFSGD